MATNTIKTKIKHLTDPSSSYVPLKGELVFLSSGLGGGGGTIKFGDDTKTVANLTAIDANYAVTAGSVPWSGITSKPSYYDAKAIKSITRSGTTFTWTCLDGTTGTFTQQDNNTTYSAATTSTAGLMSAADKTKLDGIATGANNYSLPTASSSTLGGVKIGSNITLSSGVISLTKANVTTALGYTPPTSNTTYSAGSGLSLSGTTFSVASAPQLSAMFTPDSPGDNTTGYRLIGTRTSSSWWNGRDVLVVSSRHTGVGLLCFAWGHNASSTTLANAYGSITYFGPWSGNGAVLYEDAFQIYYNESNSTFYLFWKSVDYNSTYISRLATNNGWNFSNGDFMTSINTSTYGSLICKTTPCWLQGDAVTGAVWN